MRTEGFEPPSGGLEPPILARLYYVPNMFTYENFSSIIEIVTFHLYIYLIRDIIFIIIFISLSVILVLS
jgi:hypothetical protein